MRPADLTVDEKDTVWPGLHSFKKGGEPRMASFGGIHGALTLDVPQSFGIRQKGVAEGIGRSEGSEE